MKTRYKSRLLIFIFGVLCIWACQEDDSKPNVEPIEISQSVSSITYTSAKLEGDVLNENVELTNKGFCWSINPGPTLSDNVIIPKWDDFSSELHQLIPNQSYFVRPFIIELDESISYGDEVEFNTLSLEETAWEFSLTFGENGENGIWNVEVAFYKDGSTWLEDPNFPGVDTAYGTWQIEENNLSFKSGKVGEYDEHIEYHFEGHFFNDYILGNVTPKHSTDKITFLAIQK